MERLTDSEGNSLGCERCEERRYLCKEYCYRPEIKLSEKLAYYEQLEEEGLLIKLPCKVGATVYILKKGKFIHHFGVEKGGVVKATMYKISKNNDEIKYYFYYTFGWEKIYFEGDDDIFGKSVFLTHEEAELKLKEIK